MLLQAGVLQLWEVVLDQLQAWALLHTQAVVMEQQPDLPILRPWELQAHLAQIWATLAQLAMEERPSAQALFSVGLAALLTGAALLQASGAQGLQPAALVASASMGRALAAGALAAAKLTPPTEDTVW